MKALKNTEAMQVAGAVQTAQAAPGAQAAPDAQAAITPGAQVAPDEQAPITPGAQAVSGAQAAMNAQAVQGPKTSTAPDAQAPTAQDAQATQPTHEPCDIAAVFARHVKTVYRLCYSYFGSPHDAEDATQAVFLKLVAKPRSFDSETHEKAWLLTVAANYCKDVLKSAARTRAADMPPDVPDPTASVERSDLLEAVLALPPQYKDCVYLHYYEGYKTDEIARMTDAPPSTIRNRLRDARALLKAAL